MAETDTDAGSSLAPGYADQVARLETGGASNADTAGNPRSTALGRHQFVAGTWMAFAKANPSLFPGMSDQEILDKRTDPNYSRMGADWYARYNSGILQQHGFAPTAANLGLAHGFGAQGAVGILSQPDTMKLSDALAATQGQDAATRIMAANPGYLNLSVGDIKGRYAGFGGKIGTVPDTPPASTNPTTPPPVTPPAVASTVNPQLAQMQKLALLNRLLTPPQEQQTAQATNASALTGPYAWANSAGPKVTPYNPLQTMLTLQALNSNNPLLTV